MNMMRLPEYEMETKKNKMKNIKMKNIKIKKIKTNKMTDMLQAIVISVTIIWVMFRSVFFMPLLIVIIPLFMKYKSSIRSSKLKSMRQVEFKNMMAMLYSVTAAGGTLERALRSALKDMQSSPERYTLLTPELVRVCKMLDHNVPVARALEQFAERNDDEDIRQFVRILLIAGKSGGSLPDIINRSSEAVSLRMDMNAEVETLLSGKRAELRVMMVIPVFILVYMNISSPDYMSSLYDSMTGRGVMLFALIVYAAAFAIGRKILDIRV